MTAAPIMPAPQEPVPAFAALRGPRVLVVGSGQRGLVPTAVRHLGQRVLVCTDARMATDPNFLELIAALGAAGLNVNVFSDVQAELPETTITASVDQVRAARPDVVLGVGGGSCLDHAKVAAVLLGQGGQPADYYGENRVGPSVLPVVAVPTTAGTGSEVTPVAVLTDSRRPVKVGISSPYLIPHTAIVDPELAMSCPPALTVHSGADALAHCVESFTAIRRTPTPTIVDERVFIGASLVTDGFALAGIGLIGRSLAKVVNDPADRSARESLSLAALYGGLALGTAGTAAAHAIQYPVGALTHTPHGLGVGLLLPYVMQFNLPARIPEMTRIGVALGRLDADANHKPDRHTAALGIDAVEDLLGSVGIPRSLADIGVSQGDLSEIATLTMGASRLVENNPRALSRELVARIVQAAFAGERSSALEDD